MLPAVGKARVTIFFSDEFDREKEVDTTYYVRLTPVGPGVNSRNGQIDLKHSQNADVDIGIYLVEVRGREGLHFWSCGQTNYSFPVQRHHFAITIGLKSNATSKCDFDIHRKHINSFHEEKRALASNALNLPRVKELVDAGFRGAIVVPSDTSKPFDMIAAEYKESFAGFRGEAYFTKLYTGDGGKVVATDFLVHEKLLLVIVEK